MTEGQPQTILEDIATQLAQLHRSACGDGLDDALQAYERAESATRSFLDAELPSERGALEDVLAEALDSLEADARDTFTDSSLDDLHVTRVTAALRARCTVLRLVARKLHDRPARDELPFLFAELRDLERYARRLDADAAQALRSARSEAVVVRAAHALKRAIGIETPITSASGAETAFDVARAMRRAEVGLSKIDNHADHGEAALQLLEAIDQQHERLMSSYLEWIGSARSAPDREVALRLGSVLSGEIDEARVGALDSGNRNDGPDIEKLVADGNRMLAALLELARGNPSVPSRKEAARLRRTPRRLRRLIRRLRDLQADQILRQRLDRVFRPRVVRAWEALVFWLIVAVLGLILVEHYTGPGPGPDAGIPWTVWVDTGICFVLLLDFSTRMLLTPRRARYFYRHFLTEFLPALPLGLMASMADHPGVRSVRALRLVRVFRVLRLLQPAIRFLRLLLFVLRAADRIVERNAWLLNRNIVFFAQDTAPATDPPLVERARDLDGWIQRTSRERYDRVDDATRTAATAWSAGLLITALRHREVNMPSPDEERRSLQPESVDLENVIHTLRGLDDSRVADLVGPDLAWQITTSLRFIRLPVLRSLPGIRFILGPTGSPDPLWFTARVGRVLGDLLDVARRTITWFTDLHGTITGSQFLDRIGLQLVKATARPTKRLLLFALLTILLAGMVHLVRLHFLSSLMNGIVGFLLLPVSVIGVICAVPLLLGIWFRRIAGQAVDFFDRVAEAQFLSLTEIGKQQFAETRLPDLTKRVLLPEAKILGISDDDAHRAIVEEISHRACDVEDTIGLRRLTGIRPGTVDRGRADFMLLFYRDFVDGAWFHRNDTKIASFLLGNLTLENIRVNRFRYTRADQKRVTRLDIARGRGGILGPTPWFNFITHAVAQRTARLIIEYNQHCIPQNEVDSADSADRRIFEKWLERREEISRQRRTGQPVPQVELSGADGTLAYRTTEFNALHFLTVDERRDDLVREHYGERVLALLEEDRRMLIRQTFGTFPVHELPVEQRTFNPYEFYSRYVSRGRVFLTPFLIVWFGLRVLRLLLKRLIAIIRDVLVPEARVPAVEATLADFGVARRKLHRMRRPMVLEAIRTRARFDLEYLGLELLRIPSTVAPEHRLAQDLRQLDATEREWEEFRELKSERQAQLELLDKLLDEAGLTGAELEREIVRRNPSLQGREHEAVRALVLAYVCDTRGVRSFVEARYHLREWISFLAAGGESKRPTRRGWFRSGVGGWLDRAWPLLAGQDQVGDDALRLRFQQSIARGARMDLRRLETVATFAERTAARKAHEVNAELITALLTEAEGPSSWTEQIVAVRTVQSLGMIDLAGYEDIIVRLGGYERTDESRRTGPPRHL